MVFVSRRKNVQLYKIINIIIVRYWKNVNRNVLIIVMNVNLMITLKIRTMKVQPA